MPASETIAVEEEPVGDLHDYAEVSIAFEVDRVLDVSVAGPELEGIALSERRVTPSYTKDYDALPGNHPTTWSSRLDLSSWARFAARSEGNLVGSALVAFDTPGLFLLEGRADLAVLWDLRVAPERRGQGVGGRLLSAACEWAAERNCRQLKIETQNNNVSACRFYAGQGCTLGGIHRFAYPDLPDETQLLFYKDLGPAR